MSQCPAIRGRVSADIDLGCLPGIDDYLFTILNDDDYIAAYATWTPDALRIRNSEHMIIGIMAAYIARQVHY
jgi:hypothetical protein